MLTDLRYAIRALRRSPGFTIVAILTLGLGIGANTTVFSWMEGLVLQPLPFVRDSSRLVSVSFVSRGGSNGVMSYPAFAALAERTRTVDGLAAFAVRLFGVQDVDAGDPAAPVGGAFTSVSYFRTLGVGPVLGRTFEPADTVASAEPVVVLGHALWRQRFAGDAGVIGRTVRVNGHNATVIGVAPAGFLGAEAGYDLQLWTPLASYDRLGEREGELRTVYSRWLTVFGRLHAGTSVQQARAELDAVGRQLVAERPDLELGATSAAAHAVTERTREAGVRVALGATSRRVMQTFLAESLRLAGFGLAIGALGALAVGGLLASQLYGVGGRDPLTLVGTALLLALVVAVAAYVPARRATRVDPVIALRSE
jgi:hypothetical protein